MSVIGTAGHIDHGKSTLVKALTGIDPDRLQEEKNRGMTIDLGFAWLSLPSGKEASIVDVPGHEGFIKNMLAGVGGIDLALLIVAADDGVMPQTREHLAILNLLKVTRGLTVITKKDLVDDEWVEMVTVDIEETTKSTFLADAPIVAVSAITGEGIPELLAKIDSLLEEIPTKRDIGRPRLPIDRIFTVAGFGTVVTGTLLEGTLAVGQEVVVVPGREKARIRGLQTHRQKVNVALPGTRVAVNLTGVTTQDLERGMIVTKPGWLSPTRVFDAKISMTSDAPSALVHGAGITVHWLASFVNARLRLLDSELLAPGETGYAQIVLSDPLASSIGDRFIIRNGAGTVGGGEVIDLRPKRHRRFDAPTLEILAAMSESAESMILSILGRREPCEIKDLAATATLPPEEVKSIMADLLNSGRIIAVGNEELEPRTILVSAKGWQAILGRAEDVLKSYHRQYPLREGISKEELRSRLHRSPRIATKIVDRLVAGSQLIGDRLVEVNDSSLRLATHSVTVSSQDKASIDAVLAAVEYSHFKPPADLQMNPEIINYLLEQKRIVRLSDELILGSIPFSQMVERVLQRVNTEEQISLVEVRDMFETTRSCAFALLEYLDHSHQAKRVGSTLVRF